MPSVMGGIRPYAPHQHVPVFVIGGELQLLDVSDGTESVLLGMSNGDGRHSEAWVVGRLGCKRWPNKKLELA
eukprot:COSAG02_NODE_2786_length_7987_cov_4.920303_1_plen_72_part_00